MRNDDEEYNSLYDDDPALDCIFFEEMRKENAQRKGRGSC